VYTSRKNRKPEQLKKTFYIYIYIYIAAKKAICLVARDILYPRVIFAQSVRPQYSYGNTVRCVGMWLGTERWDGWRDGIYTIVDDKSEKPDGATTTRVEIFTAGNRNKFWGRIDAAKLTARIYIYICAYVFVYGHTKNDNTRRRDEQLATYMGIDGSHNTSPLGYIIERFIDENISMGPPMQIYIYINFYRVSYSCACVYDEDTFLQS